MAISGPHAAWISTEALQVKAMRRGVRRRNLDRLLEDLMEPVARQARHRVVESSARSETLLELTPSHHSKLIKLNHFGESPVPAARVRARQNTATFG